MAKRENLNPMAGLSFGTPIEAKNVDTQGTQHAQEVQHAQHVQDNKDTLNNTQGRKGHKLPRINMAFTPENHEYIKRTSRQQGISATEFVNNLIEEDKKRARNL